MSWNSDDLSLINALAGEGCEGTQQWRCLSRGGRMLLLIQDGAPQEVLKLYRPQRAVARLVQSLLTLTYPLGNRFLRRLDLSGSGTSAMTKIECQTKMKIQAMLLGNAEQEERRVIMFLEDSRWGASGGAKAI